VGLAIAKIAMEAEKSPRQKRQPIADVAVELASVQVVAEVAGHN